MQGYVERRDAANYEERDRRFYGVGQSPVSYTHLGEILRECDHERSSAVEDVDFLPLPLGEGIGEAYGGYGHGSAQSGEKGAADAYEPEVAFDIFKTFEFHTANVKRLLTCSPEFSGNPPDAVPRGLAAGVSFSCGHAH